MHCINQKECQYLLGEGNGYTLYKQELTANYPDIERVVGIRQVGLHVNKGEVLCVTNCCGEERSKVAISGNVKVEVTYKVLSPNEWYEKIVCEVPFTQIVPIETPWGKVTQNDVKIEDLTAFNADYANAIDIKARTLFISVVWRICIFE